jgi:hypothetical protein
MIDVVSERLFRRHVEGRAHHCIVGALRSDPRQAEVEDLHLPLGREHHVLGLQVPMHQIQGLTAAIRRSPGLVETIRHFDAHLHRGLGHDRKARPATFLDHLAESDPLDHLHDHRRLAFEELEHPADGAVLDLVEEVEFLDERLHGVGITGIAEHLDRDLSAARTGGATPGDLTLGEVHSPEVPCAELLLDLVLPDIAARQTSPPSAPDDLPY